MGKGVQFKSVKVFTSENKIEISDISLCLRITCSSKVFSATLLNFDFMISTKKLR